MNIAEAVKEMIASGATCIMRPARNTGHVVLKPTDSSGRTFKAHFSTDGPLSQTFDNWSPSISDLLSNDWHIFNPGMYTIKEPVREQMLMSEKFMLPADCSDFKCALGTAADEEIYIAADCLKDKFEAGEKVKSRLKAVEAEIRKREKDR